ncbi:molybdate ABC transporter substrate-binding protein [Phenylobacterium sp.]|uniref:molybdate ABC transporter substrate-binding protein n=1 Tax=Phenylobacterium sp. TaxID=1871053 RepID=UPI00271A2F80|nr:molybdate ABC transporter substrate-binding protein [Phenylobacterium sp.]MDO8379041.1 molybdate ABC transporter substrate-binding protein [Phenylobacterium sp.]
MGLAVTLTRRIAILAAAWMLIAAPALAADKPVTVFAAASLKNALDEVGAVYVARTGGEARFAYAGSSAIARQIEQGAPADIYISADGDWMDYLAGKKLVVAASRRDLLTNHLALVAPAASKVRLKIGRGMPLVKALGAGRLALAGPDVPAGRYAKASLTSLGVWDSVSGRLAQAENVRAALQYVARGESPLGIVYDTDAKVEPKVRIVGLLPEASHPRIVYPAALVAGTRNPQAGAFLSFLSGPEAGAVFRKYGFTVLERK